MPAAGNGHRWRRSRIRLAQGTLLPPGAAGPHSANLRRAVRWNRRWVDPGALGRDQERLRQAGHPAVEVLYRIGRWKGYARLTGSDRGTRAVLVEASSCSAVLFGTRLVPELQRWIERSEGDTKDPDKISTRTVRARLRRLAAGPPAGSPILFGEAAHSRPPLLRGLYSLYQHFPSWLMAPRAEPPGEVLLPLTSPSPFPSLLLWWCQVCELVHPRRPLALSRVAESSFLRLRVDQRPFTKGWWETLHPDSGAQQKATLPIPDRALQERLSRCAASLESGHLLGPRDLRGDLLLPPALLMWAHWKGWRFSRTGAPNRLP